MKNYETTHYGLDFGTSNTVISVVIGNNVTSLPINLYRNSPILESAIYFKDGRISFGSEGIEEYIKDIGYSEIKKNISITESDFYSGRLIQNNNYRLIRSLKTSLGRSIFTTTNINGKRYSIDDLITLFLTEVKNRADSLMGYSTDSVNIGRPVKFVGYEQSDAQIQNRLEKCLKHAGFKEIHFVLEPVAAAKSYGVNSDKQVFIFDFGGGTLDLSIVDLKMNKVLASKGLAIGGDLIDEKLYLYNLASYFGQNLKYRNNELDYPKWAVEQMINWSETEKLRNNDFMNFLHSLKHRSNSQETVNLIEYFIKNNLSYLLRKSLVSAKEDLSSADKSNFELQVKNFSIKKELLREEFEENVIGLLEEAKKLVLETLKASDCEPDDVQKVVLTGGSSLIPVFQNLLKSIFGEKLVVYEPFTAVSKGLALASGK